MTALLIGLCCVLPLVILAIFAWIASHAPEGKEIPGVGFVRVMHRPNKSQAPGEKK